MRPICWIFALSVMAGCSGGATNSTGATGSAIFRIEWPKPTRLIPLLTDSVRIKIVDPETAQTLKEVFVVRDEGKPFSTVQISGLPVKKLKDIVTAHAERGKGTALAEGEATVQITKDEPANVSLTLVSTIDTLERIPASDVTVPEKKTAKVEVKARNKTNEIVWFLQAIVKWETSDPKIATVESNFVKDINTIPGFTVENPLETYHAFDTVKKIDSSAKIAVFRPCTATITGVKPGVVTVTATEPESGKKTSWKVTVGNNSEIITIK